MESIYGTKKYFQSLSRGSDTYRASTRRTPANEYSSYQNTSGRHSTIVPDQHINKYLSYSTDLNLNSQHGYNTWNAWYDARNISPSNYSTKNSQNVKSFSIIISTAALIIFLAVISIGGLAFYFSTLKSNLEEPIMAFDGFFRIQKGDSFTSGLRYNHTSAFQRKADFYKRFIERSLSDNDLQITKTDVTGFGEGPSIDVKFKVFLDMRKIPQTIHSIEEHIRNSLFLETNSVKSLYRSLKIDPDSIEIKRIIDQSVTKLDSLLKEQVQSVSQTHFEKLLTEKTGPSRKHVTQQKQKLNNKEAYFDEDNSPIIQGSFEGSFEVTKTDADITHKKVNPTKSFSPYSKFGSASVPTKKMSIEKVTTPILIITTTPTTPVVRTTIASTTKATTIQTTVTSEKILSAETATESLTETTTQASIEKTNYSNVEDPPKLDMNLFTSAPILDTEPWRPIRLNSQQSNNSNLTSQLSQSHNFAMQPNFETFQPGLIPKSKIKFSDPITETPNERLFYQSFTNPVFMPATTGIEKLGNNEVKPHPIPVPLIDEVVAPNIKPVLPMHKIPTTFGYDKNQFFNIKENQYHLEEEHTETKTITTTEAVFTTLLEEVSKSEISDKIGYLLLDLLKIPTNSTEKYKMESVKEEETERPHFLNIKELVLNKTKIETTTPGTTTESFLGTIDQSMLFPSLTKWEYINSTSNTHPIPPKLATKKVFNNTLQAWIVGNQENLSNISLKDFKINKNTTDHLQNISLIFDNLASKLGITSSFPTKVPPFSTSSQNKIKQSQNLKEQFSSVFIKSTSTQAPIIISTTSEYQELLTQSKEPEAIVGAAEVEIVDPTKYDEILSSQSASSTTIQTPTLVTLLPVRSNSGIRIFKPISPSSENRQFNYHSTFREAVVKTGIQVST